MAQWDAQGRQDGPNGQPAAPICTSQRPCPPKEQALNSERSQSSPTPRAVFSGFAYQALNSALLPTSAAPGEFLNPILSGCWPDPTLIRVGADFHLANSSFTQFPGLPIHHSRDLVNWSLLTHAIDRPTQLRYAGLSTSRGLFAPSLSHHAGRWYLLCTMVDAGGNFILTAEKPEGPWSDPVWLDFGGIDPSLFVDRDGSAWIVHNDEPQGPPRYDGHRALWLQRIDLQTLKMVGPRRMLVDGGADPSSRPIWIEGPHLFRRGEWLYLCCAEGGTSLEHSQVILRAHSLDGPFEAWQAGNPILTQRDLDPSAPDAVTCAGHAQLVELADGSWWASFLACRPDNRVRRGGHWLNGRETFLLPVQWTADGWPRILPRRERIPLRLRAPFGATQRPQPASFRWQAGDTLDAYWLALRAPHAARVVDGKLHLPVRADRADSSEQTPAVLLRRVQHGAFEAECALAPPSQGVAGLLLFQSERQQLRLLAGRVGSELQVAVEQVNAGHAQRVGALALGHGAASLRLRMRCDGDRVSFDLATTDAGWRALPASVDARDISVQAAGDGLHFTGALIGLYAVQAFSP